MKEKSNIELSPQLLVNQNAVVESIIEESPQQNQDTEKPVDCDLKLSHYIKQQRLTDSLEILENVGYSNDSTIRRIQYFQWEGL